jgi:hypothetical protein
VSNLRSILILSFNLLSHLFPLVALVATLAFNYPNNVGHNLGQQRGQLSTVTVLWTGDRGIVFRFLVGAQVFLVLSHPSVAGVKHYSYIPRPRVCLPLLHSYSFTCL